MFLSKSSRLQKFLVGAFTLFFAWLVFTCIHNANPVDHSNDGSMSCDMSTVVSQVACTQDSSILLLLTILGGFGFIWIASGYPQQIPNVLYIRYLLPVNRIKRPAFSPLLEMFRKGIIHPKLYSC